MTSKTVFGNVEPPFCARNPKHEEGHFAELTAVLGIAAELRYREAAVAKKRI